MYSRLHCACAQYIHALFYQWMDALSSTLQFLSCFEYNFISIHLSHFTIHRSYTTQHMIMKMFWKLHFSMNKNYEWAITSRQDVQRCACAATDKFVPTSNTITSLDSALGYVCKSETKLFIDKKYFLNLPHMFIVLVTFTVNISFIFHLHHSLRINIVSIFKNVITYIINIR